MGSKGRFHASNRIHDLSSDNECKVAVLGFSIEYCMHSILIVRKNERRSKNTKTEDKNERRFVGLKSNIGNKQKIYVLSWADGIKYICRYPPAT